MGPHLLILVTTSVNRQIAATELLAPSPFASAEWGLKHAVPPVEGPAELSSARSLGSPSTPGTLASPPSVGGLAPNHGHPSAGRLSRGPRYQWRSRPERRSAVARFQRATIINDSNLAR
ncbi:hypothetical protein COCSUDRAFT_62779 [Coccomyxa subellipsoidea C-169]|uniref:Uncharacterized protein n=1 Tax=Coccomyxa subellipsoidea (strain C-169) TaxID=574566 RepID=I0Z0V4_COCSC|nr:hypothetical protein COCSUDRAFT_62779 [Coccomyxa subellipsoidea C-169]EIE24273.1 hypothetical protein COCSUDRAFT_62779 [Coccomyxa subellipsoidea C-169]|eukprot:XP_005648817.1 hypothetical protein COCSUDRAFT_62779 [Coccomyxa subellipsoidea C-169]